MIVGYLTMLLNHRNWS